MMPKLLALVSLVAISAVIASQAQDKADVRMEQPQPFRAGGSISFTVKLNEPLPKGAHFDFRVSPVAADEEISLGVGEQIGDSGTEFRVSGKLPEGALPGEWHISVIIFSCQARVGLIPRSLRTISGSRWRESLIRFRQRRQ